MKKNCAEWRLNKNCPFLLDHYKVASFAGGGQKKIFVAAGIAADQDKAFIINLQHKH